MHKDMYSYFPEIASSQAESVMQTEKQNKIKINQYLTSY